ncbi:MAG: type II secretion system major pseudopilin GspG [Candidatus Omnitrophota bacterium]|nr:type II secretion system major pseudopilin GspG [Candidatus Omnitrophota bacterium]
MRYEKGFTLIELLLVVVILASLAAMVIPRFAGRTEQAKIAVAGTDVTSNIPVALDLYELDNGRYPASLEALLTNPGGAKNWSGPYIKKKPIDPWGNQYQYRCPSSHGRDFDLYSFGPDGTEGSDDVTNWEE